MMDWLRGQAVREQANDERAGWGFPRRGMMEIDESRHTGYENGHQDVGENHNQNQNGNCECSPQ